MTQTQFDAMLAFLMRRGLHISMFMEDEVIWFDLNTGMKSHLHLTYDKEKAICEYRGRYDTKGTITDLDDLRLVIRDCDCGRGFASGIWHKLLEGAWYE